MPLISDPAEALLQTVTREQVLIAARAHPGSSVNAKLRGAIGDLTWPVIYPWIESHLKAVLAEHEMVEGPAPAGNMDADIRNAWDSELDDALRASLDPLVPNKLTISDAERITVASGLELGQQRITEVATDLTKCIVGGPWSLDSACEKMGITEDDRNSLLALPTAPAVAAQVLGNDMIEQVVREYMNTPDGDLMQAMEWLNEMAGTDDVMAASAASHLGFQFPQAAFPAVRLLTVIDGWLDTLLANAMQPAEKPKGKPAAAPKPATTREREIVVDGEKPGSKRGATVDETDPALLIAFETLLEHTDMTEALLSKTLGISRAQLNNIRKKERGYVPNETAKSVIKALFDARIRKLTEASEQL